jgi:hypothetical protein
LALPNGKTNEIINLWNSDSQPEAIKEINKYIGLKIYRETEIILAEEYQNYFDASLCMS